VYQGRDGLILETTDSSREGGKTKSAIKNFIFESESNECLVEFCTALDLCRIFMSAFAMHLLSENVNAYVNAHVQCIISTTALP